MELISTIDIVLGVANNEDAASTLLGSHVSDDDDDDPARWFWWCGSTTSNEQGNQTQAQTAVGPVFGNLEKGNTVQGRRPTGRLGILVRCGIR